jgi:hypothetical protein
MGLRDKLRRLQRIADKDLITFELKDGTVARFPAEVVFPEAFIHETQRWKAAYRGDPVPERHPFIEALRNIKVERVIETIASEHGSVVSLMLGEDRIAPGELSREEAIAEMRRARGLDKRAEVGNDGA